MISRPFRQIHSPSTPQVASLVAPDLTTASHGNTSHGNTSHEAASSQPPPSSTPSLQHNQASLSTTAAMAYHSFVKKEVKREDSKSWLNLPTFDCTSFFFQDFWSQRLTNLLAPSSSVPKVEIKPERDVRSITMDNIPRAPFRQDGVPKTDRSVGFNMNNVPQANPGPSTGLQDTCLFTDFFGAVAPRRRNRGRRRAPNQPFTGLCFDCGEKGHRQRMCPIDATRELCRYMTESS